jgi:hypothetical protein
VQGLRGIDRGEEGSMIPTWRERFAWAAAAIGFVVIIGAFVLMVAGCADLTTASTIRDEAYDTLAERGPIVERDCVVRAEVDREVWRALPVGSREREQAAERALAYQRATRCPEAVTAYTSLKAATVTLDAALKLAASGQCMGTRSKECSVGTAALSAATATTSVVGLVKHVEANR